MLNWSLRCEVSALLLVTWRDTRGTCNLSRAATSLEAPSAPALIYRIRRLIGALATSNRRFLDRSQ